MCKYDQPCFPRRPHIDHRVHHRACWCNKKPQKEAPPNNCANHYHCFLMMYRTDSRGFLMIWLSIKPNRLGGATSITPYLNLLLKSFKGTKSGWNNTGCTWAGASIHRSSGSIHATNYLDRLKRLPSYCVLCHKPFPCKSPMSNSSPACQTCSCPGTQGCCANLETKILGGRIWTRGFRCCSCQTNGIWKVWCLAPITSCFSKRTERRNAQKSSERKKVHVSCIAKCAFCKAEPTVCPQVEHLWCTTVNCVSK